MQLNYDKILSLIKQNNYSLDDLARKTNVNKSTLTKIIYGSSKNPGILNMLALAQSLKCSVYDFLEGYEESMDVGPESVPVYLEDDKDYGYQTKNPFSHIAVDSGHNASFAVKVTDNDMSPTLEHGDFALFKEIRKDELVDGKVVFVSLSKTKPEIMRSFVTATGMIFLKDNVAQTEPKFYPFDDYFKQRVEMFGELVELRAQIK